MNDRTFITSQVRVMQEQEQTEAYRCNDYLGYRTEFGPEDRQALCTWGYRMIKAFTGINRLTVVRAISYFDRYMSTSHQGREQQVETIQLAFISALLIALKADSGFKVELDFFARVVTRDGYGEDEIRRMEMEILIALQWRLSGPAPHEFIDRFLEVIPGVEAGHIDFLHRFSTAVAEVAITRYSIALQYPSVIAFSAICCGLEYLESIYEIHSLRIRGSLQSISGLSCNDLSLKWVIESMVHIVLEIFSEDDLPSFAGQGGTDNSSVSSEDSPTSIFHVL